jgi:sugar (pentulose or hexulose) kinase
MPDTDLEVDLAFFASAVGNRGGLRNIRLENLSVGHLFRAAFENMADNYSKAARRLSPNDDWNRIVLSGGLCQKLPALREIILGRFGRPHRMVEASEETLIGLARLARDLC